MGGKAGSAYTQTVTAYDSLSRATGTQLQLPDSDPFVKAGQPSTLSFETYYNIDGTLKGTKEPAVGGLESEAIDYGYDGLGDLTDFGGLTGYLRNVSYSALGQPLQLTLGTGGTDNKSIYVTNRYETGTDRLTRSHVTDQTHPWMLQDLNYSYDESGNVTAISDPTTLGGDSSPDTQCFAYDGHQRLTEAWTPTSENCADPRSATSLAGPAPYWKSYTYNNAGQRLTATDHKSAGDTKTTYCYTKTTQPHTLTGTSTKTDCTTPERAYSYDTTGNTTQRPGASSAQSLTWSPEGKLTELTEAGASTNYIYDAVGSLLIRAKDNGERILYAGATELHLRANGTTWAQRYYSAGGITAAFRSNESGANKLTYLTGDHHGTSSLALTPDTAQTFTKRYTTPFGEDRGKPQYGPWPDDKGFLGKTRDANTGLTHIGAREYDPVIGQFLSVDPILSLDQPQSLNGYSYSGNNPLTFSDPSGLRLFEGDNDGWVDSAPAAAPKTIEENKKATGTPEFDANYYGPTPVVVGVGTGEALFETPEIYGQAIRAVERREKGLFDVWMTLPNCTMGQEGCLKIPWHMAAQDVVFRVICKIPGVQCSGRQSFREQLSESATYLAPYENVLAGLRGRGAARFGASEGKVKNVGCSFSPDTVVLLSDGKTKAISSVEAGDEVAAGDPRTGKRKGSRTVDARLVHHDDDLVALTIRSDDGHKSIIHTTSRHPFWDDTLSTWVPAGKLKSGHALNTATNRHTRVVAVQNQAGAADMYNLTVEDLHTYYVLAGATPVLVHNSNCPTGKAPRTPDGKFAKRNGEPGTDGSLDERTVMDQLELDGAPIIRGQVYARVPGFPLRKYDGAVQIDGRWLGVETKGGSSPLTPPLRRFDDWLNTPGNSVATGGGITLEGTFNAWVPR